MKTLLERIADMAACVGGNVEEVLLDAAKEINALRVKVEAMEKQEPVAFVKRNLSGQILLVDAQGNGFDLLENLGVSLFALPGAQPASSVLDDGFKRGVECAVAFVARKAEMYAIRFGHDDMGGLSFGRGPQAEAKMDHYTSLMELSDELCGLFDVQAPNAPEDVMRDAERYRLIRRGQHWSVVDGIGDDLRADTLDSAVDKELAAAPEAKP